MVVNDPAFFLSHRREIARAAQARGWQVDLVTAPEPAAAVAEIRALGLGHHALEMARGQLSPLADLRLCAALARLFDQLKPDLVHLVTVKPVLWGGIAARRAGVPGVVAALSGLGMLFMDKGPRMRAIRSALAPLLRYGLNRPGVRLVFQNEDDRATVAALGVRTEGRAALVRGSGVDLARFDPERAPDRPPIVAMPARMLFVKGAGEFVAAARRLRAEGWGPETARFVYLGAADPANPSRVPEATRAGWEAEGAVEFWGHRTDIPDCLARATVVVLPSYREGVPKALLEAAAAGRPVVTTDVPGCRDAIRAGETGILVPPRDADALARAIAGLLSDPARARAMGRAGRALAERAFSVEDVVARHLALYDEVLGSDPCAASPVS